MHPLCTIVTIVSVLIHGFLGCCWHHDHAEVATASRGKSHCCCQHHHAQGASPGEGHKSQPDHQPHHKCEGESCVFARTEAGHHTDFLITPAVDSLSLVACAPTALVTERSWAELFSPPLLRPPVRSHLLHRVLLI